MIRSCLMVAVLACWVTTVNAQDVPSAIEPGQIEKRFETPPQLQQTDPDIPTVLPEELVKPEAAEQFRFILNGIKFDGMTAYAEADLESLYQDQLKQEISLNDVYRIAEALTATYRSDGYLLSRVIVPSQRIQDGVVRLQVIEGYINQVTIDEQINGSMQWLEHYAEKLRLTRPLTTAVLERYLLLANDLPGVTLRAVFSPSEVQAGAADLTLILRQDRYSGFASLDNRGSEFIGPYQVQAGLALNGLFAISNRTQLQLVTTSQTNELRFFEFEHQQQITAEGTNIVANLRRTDSQPGFTLKDLDVETESSSAELLLSTPFVRSRSRNLYGHVSFNYRDSATDILDTDFSEDRLRGLRAGLQFDRADIRGNRFFAEVEFSHGLDILDASDSDSPDLSREDGAIDYAKISAEFLYLRLLPAAWSMLFGITAQYSADPLLASEQFSLGGSDYGRAYDPSELAGDHGVALKAELQHNFSANLSDAPLALQFFTYYDIGAVENRDTDTASFESESLASAGLGLRFNYQKKLTGTIEGTVPLTRDVAAEGRDGEDPRVFFTIERRF